MTKDDTILKQKFESLFKEYFTGLVFFAQKYLDDVEASKDLVHSVFIKIWEKRREFEFDKPAKSYLFTSVYNGSMNIIRDNKKFVVQPDENQQELMIGHAEFNDTMETAELESRIKMALQKLPPKCLQIFELSRFEGKKYGEIASKLNISVKTVEGQMSKALKVMKEELKDYLIVLIIIILKNNNLL